MFYRGLKYLRLITFLLPNSRKLTLNIINGNPRFLDAQKEEKKEVKGKKIRLYLRGTPTPGGKEIEIPLENPNATIFSYVQMLILHGMSGVNQSDRLRRAWEPNFTYVLRHLCRIY